MYKQEFMARLNAGLAGLPREDLAERLAFYSEMIDDRMEEGMPEEQAVACAGNVDDIVAQAIAETPFAKLVKERARTGRRLGVWEIVLLVLGFPLWFPLLLAAFVVPVLPYLLAFAAGAMLYVVVEELIPEMSEGDHSNLGTVFFAVGFTLMMVLDVALG